MGFSPIETSLNHARWFLKPNINVVKLVGFGPVDLDEGVILFRRWSPTSYVVPSSMLRGNIWVKVRGLHPKLWSNEYLNQVSAKCGSLWEVDASTFKLCPPPTPRIRLIGGDLGIIPTVISIQLHGWIAF